VENLLTEVIINMVTQSPLIAFLLWQIISERKMNAARLERKDQIINRYAERERELNDRLVNRLFDETAPVRKTVNSPS